MIYDMMYDMIYDMIYDAIVVHLIGAQAIIIGCYAMIISNIGDQATLYIIDIGTHAIDLTRIGGHAIEFN